MNKNIEIIARIEDRDRAKELIRMAAHAGCTAIAMSADAGDSLAFVDERFSECSKLGLAFVGAPRDYAAAVALKDMGCERLKIDSRFIIDTYLLDKIAALGLPVLIAVGACSYHEMSRALSCFPSGTRTIMHHVAGEHVLPTEVNLMVMKTLRGNFRGELGFVDQSTDSTAALIALGFGARVFEVPCNAKWAVSEYVEDLRYGALMLGSDRKVFLPCEAAARADADADMQRRTEERTAMFDEVQP